MKVRRFTPAGAAAFSDFVLAARADAKAGLDIAPLPHNLIWNDELSAPADYDLPEGEPIFSTKLAIGEFVSSFVPESAHETAREDAPLWTWLAARYFDQLTAGRRKIKEPRAYLAGLTFQDFYRHLILGPYFVYSSAREDPSRVEVLLYDEPTTMNEVMVQVGSYQTLMQNPELQKLLQRLYFDERRGRIKRGAGGKEAGSPRRLMTFIRQIELNFDLRSIGADQFWSMLPPEFGRFKTESASTRGRPMT